MVSSQLWVYLLKKSALYIQYKLALVVLSSSSFILTLKLMYYFNLSAGVLLNQPFTGFWNTTDMTLQEYL